MFLADRHSQVQAVIVAAKIVSLVALVLQPSSRPIDEKVEIDSASLHENYRRR
jgi:hypothetical protein